MPQETPTPTETGTQSGGTPSTEQPTSSSPSGGRTFTQAELDAIVQREKREAKQQADRQVQEQLGVSPEEAKRILEERQAEREAQMSEVQKKEADAAQKDRQATERERIAAEKEFAADLRIALVEEGMPVAKIARYAKLVEAQPGDDTDAIKAAVATLKTEEPALFHVEQSEEPKGKGPKPPSGDPQGAPPKPKVSDDAKSRGSARAAERNKRFGKNKVAAN